MIEITHQQREATIAAGKPETLEIHGDFYYIDVLYKVADGSAQKIDLAINDGPFTVCSTGQMRQGAPGLNQIKKLKFKNTTGSDVFVRVLYGKGICNFAPNISIDFAAGAVTALAAAINAPVELKLKIQTVAAGAGAVVYSNCKSLEVIAVGVSGSVRIQTPSGTDYFLAFGVGKEFSCETDNNHMEPITITPDANCGFEVTALYF